jgi:hypothetical protein
MNTHVRDNFLETAAAKVTGAGDVVYASGANALARLAAGGAYRHARLSSNNSALEYDEVGIRYVVKSADESVTSSTSLQNDDHLVLAIAANEKWVIDYTLIFSCASADPDAKIDFTVPSGAAGGYFRTYLAPDTFTPALAYPVGFATATAFAVSTIEGPWISVRLWIRNGPNAGNVQLRWAQNTSDGDALSLLAGSFMQCTRVA